MTTLTLDHITIAGTFLPGEPAVPDEWDDVSMAIAGIDVPMVRGDRLWKWCVEHLEGERE